MPKVLITDYVHPRLVRGLQDLGMHVVYAPELERPEVRQWLPSFEGVVVNTKTPVDGPMMDACRQLRFVGRLGSGVDIFDLAKAAANGIAVINTPGANANAVGEHMFGMLLALVRHLPEAHREVSSGVWLREKNRGIELHGKTIGIIGFGNTGSAFASKFAGWETQVLAYDKYKRHFAEGLRFVEETDLANVLAKSDVVSLHVPLTEETSYLVDAEFLQKCRRGVILLNSSRGKVVDTRALLDGLRSGQVGGACLDVMENEKPHTYSLEEQQVVRELAGMRNVIMSPHIAGWTWTSRANIARQLLSGISALKW